MAQGARTLDAVARWSIDAACYPSPHPARSSDRSTSKAANAHGDAMTLWRGRLCTQASAQVRASKNPGRGAGVWIVRMEEDAGLGSGRDLRVVVGGLAQDIAAAPNRLDVVLAVRGVGELLAQLADEHVDNLELRLVHAAIEMIEEHLLGER